MSIDLILLIAAFILFIAAGLNINARGLGLGWFGLACWVLTTLI